MNSKTFSVLHESGGVIISRLQDLINFISTGKREVLLKCVSRLWPSNSFDYKFADAEYQKNSAQRNVSANWPSVFAVLAISSCLGLFGMASFMAEQRTKEIGVREKY